MNRLWLTSPRLPHSKTGRKICELDSWLWQKTSRQHTRFRIEDHEFEPEKERFTILVIAVEGRTRTLGTELKMLRQQWESLIQVVL